MGRAKQPEDPQADAWPMPTARDIAAIVKLLPVFERPGFVAGECMMPEGSTPYWDYVTEVREFEQALYKHKWVVEQFDWPAWLDQARLFNDHLELVAEADLVTIQKLFTTIVRQERFCEGTLDDAFESGLIVAMLRQVKEVASAS